MRSHIKTAAILHIVIAALNLIIGVIIFILAGGVALLLPIASDEPNAALVSGFLFVFFMIISIAMVVTALPGIIAGIGMLKYATWGRILGIIVSILYIPLIPLGTILGAYTLWVLFSDDTTKLFNERL